MTADNTRLQMDIVIIGAGGAGLTAAAAALESGAEHVVISEKAVFPVNPTIFGYVSKHYPSEVTGRLGGLMIFFFTFGATAGQGISSYLLIKTGFYWSPMLLMSIITFFGALLVFVLRLPRDSNTLLRDRSK